MSLIVAWRVTDFHRLDCVHTRRTRKNGRYLSICHPLYKISLLHNRFTGHTKNNILFHFCKGNFFKYSFFKLFFSDSFLSPDQMPVFLFRRAYFTHCAHFILYSSAVIPSPSWKSLRNRSSFPIPDSSMISFTGFIVNRSNSLAAVNLLFRI